MRQRLVVLNYHQVPEQADPLRPDQVDRRIFREQLTALKRYFNVLDLGAAVDAMRDNSLPARTVAITFDDGYRDNYDVALEELQQAQCPATFFIATDYLDGGRMWNDTLVESIRRTRATRIAYADLEIEPLGTEGEFDLGSNERRRHMMRTLIPKVKYLDPQTRQQAVERLAQVCQVSLPDDMMMSSEHIKGLHDAGMGIGGHTSSHPILLRLPLEEAKRDIERGRDALNALLDTRIRFFAYPNGKLNQDFGFEHTGVLNELGFDAAFTTQWGFVDKNMPSYELPRVGFGRSTGWKLTLKVLRSFFDAPAEFAKAGQVSPPLDR